MTGKTSILEPIVLSRETESVLLGGHPLRKYPSIPGYLENFDAGREATPESKFYSNQGLSRAGVLDKTIALIQSWDDIPSLQEYELSRIQKYGPQGWIYPLGSDEQIAKIEAYWKDCFNPCSIPKHVYEVWFDLMAGPELVPYTPAQVIARQLEKHSLDSNCGLMHSDAFNRRVKVISLAIAEANKIRVEADVWTYASVLGGRSQKQKERLIFMMPMPVNIVELQYVYALMDAMEERLTCVSAWGGQPAVEPALNEYMFEDGAIYLSTDYTAMDTTVGPAQNEAYLEAVLPLFQPEFRARYARVVRAKETMPVVIGALKSPGSAQGERKSYHLVALTGTHGKTSGEGDTNAEETVLGILHKLYLATRPKVNQIHFQQNGDDGAGSYEKRDVDLGAEFARTGRELGFNANPSKQLVSSEELHFLQRVYNMRETVGPRGEVLGAYPCVLMMNSAKNPERFASLTRTQQAVRLIEIAQNCYHHPKFVQIAHCVVEGDPVLQELRGKDWESFLPLEAEWRKMLVKPDDFASHGLAPRGLQAYDFVQLLMEGSI